MSGARDGAVATSAPAPALASDTPSTSSMAAGQATADLSGALAWARAVPRPAGRMRAWLDVEPVDGRPESMLWTASLVLLRHLETEHPAAYWRGKRVLELGAGMGHLAVGLARLGAHVTATEAGYSGLGVLQAWSTHLLKERAGGGEPAGDGALSAGCDAHGGTLSTRELWWEAASNPNPNPHPNPNPNPHPNPNPKLVAPSNPNPSPNRNPNRHPRWGARDGLSESFEEGFDVTRLDGRTRTLTTDPDPGPDPNPNPNPNPSPDPNPAQVVILSELVCDSSLYLPVSPYPSLYLPVSPTRWSSSRSSSTTRSCTGSCSTPSAARSGRAPSPTPSSATGDPPPYPPQP